MPLYKEQINFSIVWAIIFFGMDFLFPELADKLWWVFLGSWWGYILYIYYIKGRE
jgi:hypothetical protein